MLQNLYWIGLLVHTGNNSSGTIFAPEQDCSAPLLKVERPVSDRFLERSGPSLNTSVEAEILQWYFPLVNGELSEQLRTITI